MSYRIRRKLLWTLFLLVLVVLAGVAASATTLVRMNFEELARHLERLGEVSYNRFLLKFETDGYQFTVFPDGRAIIKGTNDVDKARTLYAKYIGH